MDYKVKLIIRKDLVDEDIQLINEKMNYLMEQFGIVCLEDGITYCKKEPFRKFEDVPYVVSFYIKLSEYRKYFSTFEYTSYLEGTSGTIYQGKYKESLNAA